MSPSGEIAHRLFSHGALEEPRNLLDSSWAGHIPLGFWLVSAVRPTLVVELGVDDGASLCVFSQRIQQLRLNSRCLAFGSWGDRGPFRPKGDLRYRALTQYHDPLYGEFSKLVRCTPNAALSQVPDGSVDLLQIFTGELDGSESIENDLERWCQKLSPNGVILLYGLEQLGCSTKNSSGTTAADWPELNNPALKSFLTDPQVTSGNSSNESFSANSSSALQLWKKLSSAYPSLLLPHSGGLGVIAVGPNQAEEVNWLLGLSPEDRTTVQQIFARLGSPYSTQVELKEAGAELKQLYDELQGAKDHLTALNAQIDNIHRSRSWRITAPLRALERIRRGGRRTRLGGVLEIGYNLATFQFLRGSSERRAADLLRQSGLFDPEFYLAQNPDVAQVGEDPLYHFVRRGHTEGRDPNPLFDLRYYLSQIPHPLPKRTNPVVHYLTTGANQGLNPHPIFDSAFYLRENPDVAQTGINPLSHFIRHGGIDGRSPSPLFDSEFYSAQDPSIKRRRLNPLLHYLQTAFVQKLNPNPLFDTRYYLNQYPEVANKAVVPLIHYLLSGAAEGCNPGPHFSTRSYLKQFPEVAASGINPLLHFITHPSIEGRSWAADYRYLKWTLSYDTIDEEDTRGILSHITTFPRSPLISVVMPTFNPDLALLRRAIDSVRAQLYTNWELCIADDGTNSTELTQLLQDYATADPRIKVATRTSRAGIAEASNGALAAATGEWVAFLDHDDELRPFSLYFIAETALRATDTALIYSDEDKLSQFGRRFAPHFKSDWNETLFLSQNFICHLAAYRRDVLLEAGGFRAGFDGAQDWDLAWRVVELVKPSQITHIPRVLYHWRVSAASTAGATAAKPYVLEAQQRVVQEHLNREAAAARGEAAGSSKLGPAIVEIDTTLHHLHVRFSVADPTPLVSIIIPTRDRLQLLENCVESILQKTSYRNFELIVVDNGSRKPETLKYLDRIATQPNVRVIRDGSPFNFSRLNNSAAREAQGSLIAFLNNDLEVISGSWLTEMVAQVLRPGVGAVGARLLFPNGEIQHAGVVLGIGGVAGHAHKSFAPGNAGYMNRAALTQEFSAVTGACLLTHRALFQSVGGFDEDTLSVAFNDIDLCLKVRARGLKIVYAAAAELYHHESASRGYEDRPEKELRFLKECRIMVQRWGRLLLSDPYYNPNLTLITEDFALSSPPRVQNPWRVATSQTARVVFSNTDTVVGSKEANR